MDAVRVTDDKRLRIITIDRPERRNAINSAAARAIQTALLDFDRSALRVAVITSIGNDAFSAGADVDDIPELWRCIPNVGVPTEKPVIAAVAGWAVGGGMILPMMCDLIVAAENAKFVYPEAKLGLTQGMIAGLAARIPLKIAMECMLMARPLDARRAYEVGFVNEVVPVGQHLTRAVEMAHEMAAMAPMVLAALKRFVMNEIVPQGPTEQFGKMRRQIEDISLSEDMKEGFAAFREKRSPYFTGN
ncbi:MAG TPA: enoyl-CoA hydratase-related protein [Rugosibacter sp.]|nr:enoyl-CoA hydratase-related protein [Rugosibacter sp.]